MYDKNAGLNICDVCGEYVIDGHCGCEYVLDWPGMVKIARREYEAGNHNFEGTFAEFLRWKAFPAEVANL